MRLLVTGGSGFIGTNLVAYAVEHHWDVRNIDIAPPRESRHQALWANVDILDGPALRSAIADFAPTHLVHLAARTDTEAGPLLHDYATNTTGTANVLAAAAECAELARLVVASTQFVCRPGRTPTHDEVFDPHTIYGWSKVITEQLTRHTTLAGAWTIVRPTTVWGPHSTTHPARMVSAMKRGVYMHPGGHRSVRGYGYVENVVWQLARLLHSPRELVDGRVFYVGDPLIAIRAWVDEFSLALCGKPVRVVPKSALRLVARAGDAIEAVRGTPFLLQSRRFRTMTEDYPVPMGPIREAVGDAPYTLREAVRKTLSWLDARGL